MENDIKQRSIIRAYTEQQIIILAAIGVHVQQ